MIPLQPQRTPTFVVLKEIGCITFLEILRDRVLYNVLLCGAFLLGLSVLASQLFVLQPGRVVLDFGFSALSLSCSLIAIFTGAGLLEREWSRRTISVALSKPISLWQFLLGKFTGLMLVVLLQWFLLMAVYGLILWVTGEWAEGASLTLVVGLVFVLLQSALLSAMVLFFSTFSTPALSVVLCLGCYLCGYSVSQLHLMIEKSSSPMGQVFLKGFILCLPRLEYFYLGTQLTYGLPISSSQIGWSLLYGFAMTTLFLSLAGYLISYRRMK